MGADNNYEELTIMKMGRPQTGRRRAVGFQANPLILDKFNEIRRNSDDAPSFNEAIERLFIEVIQAGKLPERQKLPDEFEEVSEIESEARIKRLEQQIKDLQDQMSSQMPDRFTQLPPEISSKPQGKHVQTSVKRP